MSIWATHNRFCFLPNSICYSKKKVFQCHAFDNQTIVYVEDQEKEKERKKQLRISGWHDFLLNSYMLVIYQIVTDSCIICHSLVLGSAWRFATLIDLINRIGSSNRMIDYRKQKSIISGCTEHSASFSWSAIVILKQQEPVILHTIWNCNKELQRNCHQDQ